MLYRDSIFSLFSIGLVITLISGCGVPGLGGSDSTSTDSRSDGVKSTIVLNIEATSGMLRTDDVASSASFRDVFFDWITPRKAHALRGLNRVTSLSTSAISVVALGPNLTDPVSTNVPEHFVEELDSGGGYAIKFKDKLEPQINLVVRVRLPNERFFYGPLYETGATESASLNPIDINIGTTYVITRLFESITTSEQLEQHLPCANRFADCQTQHQAKVQMLRSIAANAGLYEIEFDSLLTYSQSLALLEQNTGFATTVDSAISELLRTESPIALGTRRSEYPLDATPWTREYNSAYFNIGFNNFEPENPSNEVVISAASSDLVAKQDDELRNTFPIYPKLITSTDVREIRREGIVPQIPFTRTPLYISGGGTHNILTNTPIKFFSALPSDVDIDDSLTTDDGLSGAIFSRFLSTESNILLDRDVPQQIPVPEGGIDGGLPAYGWNYDPVYTRLYQSNSVTPTFTSADFEDGIRIELDMLSEPSWLTAAYYGGGKSFTLQDVSNGGFRADEIREELNLYHWEVHGQEAYEGFDTDAISGKQYGVIGYSIELADVETSIRVHADTFRWSASSTQMVETQPDDHYQSRTLERAVAGTMSETGPTSNASSNSRGYFLIETEVSTDDSRNRGLLGLDGGADAPLGHASDNGKYLAFSMNTDSKGRGLILASELRDLTPDFDSTPVKFNLQGNVFEMSTSANTLRNITGSIIEISESSTEDCEASLSLKYLKSVHNRDSNTISNSTSDSDVEDGLDEALLSASSASCSINGSEIEISFDDILENGLDLTLKGFVTQSSDESSAPGNLMNLLWIQSGALGLVFAQRDQALAAAFDE